MVFVLRDVNNKYLIIGSVTVRRVHLYSLKRLEDQIQMIKLLLFQCFTFPHYEVISLKQIPQWKIKFTFFALISFFLSPDFTHLTDSDLHLPQLQLCCVWV